MRCLLVSLAVLATSTSLSFGQLPAPEPPRGWKTAEGVAFQASVVTFDGTTADLSHAQRASALRPRSPS
jgi:hypothetical protein